MFCRQCEQAAKGTGCTKIGVCGKQPDVAALQDNLLYGLRGLACYANEARKLGAKDAAIDKFMLEGLFATVTNVDFDPNHLSAVIEECGKMKDKARDLFLKAGGKEEGSSLFARIKAFFGAEGEGKGPIAWTPAGNLVAQGEKVGIETLHADEDIRSAIEILIYGLKGMAAYADHAQILGKTDEEVMAFNHKALAATCDPELGLMDFVNLCMECGKQNLTMMGLLNAAHVENYGHPVPTPVNTGTKAGKGILVSGTMT